MLNHILVPIDGSTLSEQAIHYVQEILAPKGKLTLLSVVEQPLEYWYSPMDMSLPLPLRRAYSETEYNRVYSDVKEYLSKRADKLREKSYEVECIVEVGDPATLILEIASLHDVDAIVMTSHGRTGLSRWLFGSVTQKVISRMSCPVLIIPSVKHEQATEAIEGEKNKLAAKA